MGSKTEILDQLDNLYRLGREKIEQIQIRYDKILRMFPSDMDRISYNAARTPLEKKSSFDDPDFRQTLAEDSATNAMSVFESLLRDIHDTWFNPVICALRRTGVRNFLLRFEDGKTRRTYTPEIEMKNLPRDFENVGESIYAFEHQLFSLREIIEDYENTSQATIAKTEDEFVSDNDEIIAVFTFSQNYSICVNNRSIHTFQIGNDIADDFKRAFNNSGTPIDCKSKGNSLKTTINNLSLPPEVRKVFARQNKGKLIVNKTVRKSDLINMFVTEEQIAQIKKELSSDNSSKDK